MPWGRKSEKRTGPFGHHRSSSDFEAATSNYESTRRGRGPASCSRLCLVISAWLLALLLVVLAAVAGNFAMRNFYRAHHVDPILKFQPVNFYHDEIYFPVLRSTSTTVTPTTDVTRTSKYWFPGAVPVESKTSTTTVEDTQASSTVTFVESLKPEPTTTTATTVLTRPTATTTTTTSTSKPKATTTVTSESRATAPSTTPEGQVTLTSTETVVPTSTATRTSSVSLSTSTTTTTTVIPEPTTTTTSTTLLSESTTTTSTTSVTVREPTRVALGPDEAMTVTATSIVTSSSTTTLTSTSTRSVELSTSTSTSTVTESPSQSTTTFVATVTKSRDPATTTVFAAVTSETVSAGSWSTSTVHDRVPGIPSAVNVIVLAYNTIRITNVTKAESMSIRGYTGSPILTTTAFTDYEWTYTTTTETQVIATSTSLSPAGSSVSVFFESVFGVLPSPTKTKRAEPTNSVLMPSDLKPKELKAYERYSRVLRELEKLDTEQDMCHYPIDHFVKARWMREPMNLAWSDSVSVWDIQEQACKGDPSAFAAWMMMNRDRMPTHNNETLNKNLEDLKHGIIDAKKREESKWNAIAVSLLLAALVAALLAVALPCLVHGCWRRRAKSTSHSHYQSKPSSATTNQASAPMSQHRSSTRPDVVIQMPQKQATTAAVPSSRRGTTAAPTTSPTRQTTMAPAPAGLSLHATVNGEPESVTKRDTAPSSAPPAQDPEAAPGPSTTPSSSSWSHSSYTDSTGESPKPIPGTVERHVTTYENMNAGEEQPDEADRSVVVEQETAPSDGNPTIEASRPTPPVEPSRPSTPPAENIVVEERQPTPPTETESADPPDPPAETTTIEDEDAPVYAG